MCIDCPVGKVTNVTGCIDIVNCTICPKGTYAENGTCNLCLPGKYNDEPGKTFCLNCTPGTATCLNCTPVTALKVFGAFFCPGCNAGKYQDKPGIGFCPRCEDGSFFPGFPPNPERCLSCTNNCSLDSYLKGYCTSGLDPNTGSTFDNVTCQNCSNCSLGEYIYTRCSGLGRDPNERVCANCTNNCPPFGKYLDGSCSGIGYSNNVTCRDCFPCVAGEYIKVPCSDVATGPADRICANCTKFCPAPYGKYLSGNCFGTSYLDNIVCKPCHPCYPNEYIDIPCNPYSDHPGNRTCVQCVPPICSAQQNIVSSCDGTTTGGYCCPRCQNCTNLCEANFFVNGTCSKCSSPICSPLLLPGSTCSSDTQCTSSNCASGIAIYIV